MFCLLLFGGRLDNSEFMRNGDVVPSRLDAQAEAVSMLTLSKRNASVENSIAMISMANEK